MKPLSSPQPLSLPSLIYSSSLFPALYPLIICSPYVCIISLSCGTLLPILPSFLPSFVPPFLHAAVLDSTLVDVFPVRQLFLVFASSVPAKPMSPPLPQQNRWWIDPVRVRMGIVLGVYVCQGVYICVFSHVYMGLHMHACGSMLVFWCF